MGSAVNYVGNLDTPLLRLSARDNFTLRDGCQGVHVFGGIGSGKTSGSGKALAHAYLRAGFGGLVLAAKPEEVQLWQDYAKATGRSNSVILFGEHGGGFNFITYELARQGADGINSVIECLMRILEASRLSNPNAGRPSEAFWEDSTRQTLRNTVPVLYAGAGAVSIPDIVRYVSSAPTNPQQAYDTNWHERSFMFQSLTAAKNAPVHSLSNSDFAKVIGYWRDEYCQLDPKTRGNIAISLSTTLDRFNRGRLHRAFCTETTLVPELTFHGAIIIMDMSALTWNEDGIIGQQLFKYMWQRAVLSRTSLGAKHSHRPVFLWADEAQYFVNSFDADFQSTCRSARACTVYLSQSLPTYYSKMTGENAKHKADMLLGNFATKIFHNNADPETNRWAAETLGRSLQPRRSYNEGRSWSHSTGMSMGENTSWGTNSSCGVSSDGHGNYSTTSSFGSNQGGGENRGRNRGRTGGGTYTDGYSETMDYEVEPAFFARHLRTGGPANRNNVTALWFQAGRTFQDSGRNYLFTRFQQ